MTDPIFQGEKIELVEDFLEWEDSLTYTIGTQEMLSEFNELLVDNAKAELFDVFKICYTNPNGYAGEVHSVLQLAFHFAKFPNNKELFTSLDLQHQMNIQKNLHKMDDDCIPAYMTSLRLAREHDPELVRDLGEALCRDYLGVYDLINPDLSEEFYSEIRMFKVTMHIRATQSFAVDTVLCILTLIRGESLILEIMKRLVSDKNQFPEEPREANIADVIRLFHSWDQVKDYPVSWALTIAPEVDL